MVKRILFVSLIFGLLLRLTAESQTKWFKYDGNPVLNVGPPGSWEGVLIHADRVMFSDSIYQMWYMGFDGATAGRVGRATSRDGVTWTKDPANPIMREGSLGSWESKGSVHPYVLSYRSGYDMWYMGADNGFGYRIGHATSPDGIVWTKDSLNPVLGPGPWYNVGPTLPSVLYGWYEGLQMWFAGENSGHQLQIGYARSGVPGVNWTPRPEPVLTLGATGSWDDRNVFGPRVLFDQNAGTYQMWYGGERSDFKSQFGYATSVDGVNWTKYPGNPVFRRGPASWESSDLAFPEVLFDGHMYHMWYSGNDGSTWRVGYAVSPEGLEVAFVPELDTVDRTRDTVRVSVRVAEPAGLSFWIVPRSPKDHVVDTLRLFDDGLHGDSLASDGLFANQWVPGDRDSYEISLKLVLHDSLWFSETQAPTRFVVTALSDQQVHFPEEYSLSQNYPNPFNPTTTIRYSLPRRSHVTLTVHNTLGQLVGTLVRNDIEAGNHEVGFDATGLPSGVYFYRLQAGSFMDTKRLLLVR